MTHPAVLKESLTVTVDDQGWRELKAAVADVVERAEEIDRECRERGATEQAELVTLHTSARKLAPADPSPSQAKSSTARNPAVQHGAPPAGAHSPKPNP